MVKRFINFISLIGLTTTIGCTVAVPEVSSLGSVLFMSSKSPSPFDQKNTGDYLSFSGQCVGLVKRFQYRLDSLAWSDIPSVAPTPSGGETAPSSNTYDVDCSDRNFDFYLFMSQINSYITAQTSLPDPNDYDPARVEVQGLDENDQVVPGTLVYQRPLATGLRLEPSNYSNSAPWWLGVLETNQMIRFKVTLIDASGNETRRFSSESDLDLTLTTSLVSGSSGLLGEAYSYNGSICSGAPQSTFTFVAGDGEESIEICFSANSVTTGATIRFTISAPGFAAQEKQFTILSQNQTYNSLIAGNGYQQKLPLALVKGANYKFKSDLNPISTSNGQSVSSFRGSFLVDSQSSSVNFTRGHRYFDCGPLGLKSSQIQCSNSGTIKTMPFYMSINSNYPSSSLNLSLSSTEQAACADCLIDISGSPTAITGYQSNNIYFNVVSGSPNYSRPRFEFYRRENPSDCHEINLSLANSDGNTIPANPSSTNTIPLLSLETTTPGVSFYQNSGCTTSAQRGPNGNVEKIIPVANGQNFIIGQFTSYNGLARSGIALINEDGSLDADYNPVNLSGLIYDLLPLDDGRTLVAGDFSGGIRLLTENGQIDTSFNFTLNDDVYALAKYTVDANTEYLYVAGSFTELSLPSIIPKNKILKIVRSTNATTGVEAFTIASDSSSLSGTFISHLLIHENYLYVTGDFISPIARIARINPTTLSQDLGWPSSSLGISGQIHSITVDSTNSQIFVGGDFTTALGVARSNFAAITISTGTLVSFNVNPSFNAPVYDIKVTTNNVYASGQFSTVNSDSSYTRIVKLNRTTPLDLDINSTWIPTLNTVTMVNGLGLTDSGLMLVGDFSVVNGQTYDNLAKVSYTDSSNNMNFNKNEQSSISLSFNRFDLIKSIYVRDSTPDDNNIPVTIGDGTTQYIYNINTTD